MIGIDYNTTLNELLSEKLISPVTYESLLLHYKSFSGSTKLKDVRAVYERLEHNRSFDKKKLEEIANIFKIVDINPNTTLRELLDKHYISVRTYNVIRYNLSLKLGLGRTDEPVISQVKTEFSNPLDLLNLRNFGKKSFFELNNVLSLIPDVPSTVVVKDNIGESNDDIDESVYEVINSAYGIALCDENAYTLFIKSLYPTAEEIHYAILSDYSRLFSIYREFDINGNTKIRQYFLDYIREVLQCFKEVETSHIGIYTVYVQSENELSQAISDFSFTDRYRYFLDDFKREYIFNYYISLYNTSISVRTKHFIDKFLPTFDDFLPYVDKDGVYVLDNLSKFVNRTSKTLIEIIDMCSKVRDKFLEIEASENSTIRTNTLKEKYPFLIYKQREFVAEYQNKYGDLPYFYLLYQYLYAICQVDGKGDARNIKLFCLYNGLFEDIDISLEELAVKENLTRERIRQICIVRDIRKAVKKSFFLDFKNYSIFSTKLFILVNDVDYISIKEKEKLVCPFRAFGVMLSIYADFRYINFRGLEFLVSNKLFKSKPIEKILESIIYRSSLRHAKDDIVSIYEFIPKSSKYLQEKKEFLYYVLKQLIPSCIDLGEDFIVYKQNCIDVTTELAKILEENGKPMFLQELFIEFKSKYPNHKYDTPERLRSCIKRPIKAIGKQSKYGLEHWDNVYWGSIRDLLTECLMNSEDPVHIDELVKTIIVHFPNTNVKNIASTLSSDELSRFVQFEGGFYGLERRVYHERFIKSAIVHRYSFADRLKMFTDFIETYHRFPLSNGGEFEASLQRWCNNALSGALNASEDEIRTLNSVIEHFYNRLNYPKNAFEADFLSKCEDYKTFILENHCLPSQTNGEDLYWWIKRSKYNMNSFTDKRRHYFVELISFISSFGFKI